jgi:Flp pilus assembly protein TadG
MQTPTVSKIFRATRRLARTRERGAVAIVVGLSLVVLVGAGGLALDLSRLYVNKTELQTAADACALAAAGELICLPGTAGCLTLAQSKGQIAAATNRRDFQRTATVIAAADIRFSSTYTPNSAYAPAGTAPAGSRFAMCIARSNGITPWLMGVLGVGDQNVAAQAVATLGPGATICPGVPIGACPRTGGGSYNVGDWIVASHNDTGAGDPALGNPNGNYGANVRGTFRWVDWDYPGGGVNEVRDRLVGATVCNISPTTPNIAEPGDKQGAKSAYNTRFGLYPNGANAYDVQSAPPDRTGWSYPTRPGGGPGGGITVGQSAFANYMGHYASADPFQGNNGAGGYNSNAVSTGNAPPAGANNAASQSQHAQYGSHRRLVAIPMVDACNGVGSPITFSSMGCFLLLNPMSNGNNGDVFMEYRGNANNPTSPCASGGGPGGPGSNTGLVPTLVQ